MSSPQKGLCAAIRYLRIGGIHFANRILPSAAVFPARLYEWIILGNPYIYGTESMRCDWVKIDLDRLSLRLRVSLGRPFSEWEVQQWLGRAGFIWKVGSWFTCDAATAALMPDEILARQVRETTDGVTFIVPETTDPPGPLRP